MIAGTLLTSKGENGKEIF